MFVSSSFNGAQFPVPYVHSSVVRHPPVVRPHRGFTRPCSMRENAGRKIPLLCAFYFFVSRGGDFLRLFTAIICRAPTTAAPQVYRQPLGAELCVSQWCWLNEVMSKNPFTCSSEPHFLFMPCSCTLVKSRVPCLRDSPLIRNGNNAGQSKHHRRSEYLNL